MIRTTTKRKTSLLTLVLGSLVATSLSTGTAEAASLKEKAGDLKDAAKCKVMCNKVAIGKNPGEENKEKLQKFKDKLNYCAEHCDNSKILDVLLPNIDHLTKTNQSYVRGAKKTSDLKTLKEQKAIKEKEREGIKKQLGAENAKKKKNAPKIDQLTRKEASLSDELNDLETKINELLHGHTSSGSQSPSASMPSSGEHPSSLEAENKSAGNPPPIPHRPTQFNPIPVTPSNQSPEPMTAPTPAPLPPALPQRPANPAAANLPPPLMNSAGQTPPPRPYRAPRSAAGNNSGSNVPPPVPPLPPAPPLPPEHH